MRSEWLSLGRICKLGGGRAWQERGWEGSFRQEPDLISELGVPSIVTPGQRGWGQAHRGTGAMAATVGRALLQATVRAAPARLTDAHSWGSALPVAPAVSGTQGEAE